MNMKDNNISGGAVFKKIIWCFLGKANQEMIPVLFPEC